MTEEAYQVNLEGFEGPLDLLLHLIRESKVDIYDIPISRITEQYLRYLDLMRELNLDVAGEFLVMAATLTMIKSRTLLPDPEPEGEEEEDPRDRLVRQLLDYERFRQAAEGLGELKATRALLWERGGDAAPESTEYEVESTLFDLIGAFQELLERADAGEFHQVAVSRMSIQEKMTEVMDRLSQLPRQRLEGLAGVCRNRSEVVVLFLAILELVRVHAIRIRQRRTLGRIWVVRSVQEESDEG